MWASVQAWDGGAGADLWNDRYPEASRTPDFEGIQFVPINMLALLGGDMFQAKVPVNGSGNNQRQEMVPMLYESLTQLRRSVSVL